MKYLIGPELFWMILFAIASLLAKLNKPPSKEMDQYVEYSWYVIPMLAIFTFALWYIPVVEKRWLLLRVWVACLVGGHYLLDTILKTHSTQGPGVGTGYIAGMIYLFFILMVGSIIITIKKVS